MLSKTGEIRRDEACLDYAGSDVILYPVCLHTKKNHYLLLFNFLLFFLIFFNFFKKNLLQKLLYIKQCHGGKGNQVCYTQNQ